MSTKGIIRGIPLPMLQPLREEKGYSRKKLAEATGINYSTLWEIESRGCGASFATLAKLTEALGVTEHVLRGIVNA